MFSLSRMNFSKKIWLLSALIIFFNVVSVTFVSKVKGEEAYVFSTLTIQILLSIIVTFLLVRSLKGLLGRLNTNLSAVKSSLVGLSIQSNDTSGDLEKVTKSQNLSMSSIASSINEINAMISKNADSIEASESVIVDGSNAIGDGKNALEKVVQRINQIFESNQKILKQIETRDKDFLEIIDMMKLISEKTQVINDIVFQTKLLSFNASVESARAGEQGKGFAVVSEEIGNLAKMSGQAAAEISELLEESVRNVDSIIKSNNQEISSLLMQSTEIIDSSIKDVTMCTDYFSKISESINQIQASSHQISIASKEQQAGVESISTAMNEIANKNHQNALTASQNSKSAIDLGKQANKLTLIGDAFDEIVYGQKQEEFSLIEWKEEYEINAGENDEQHKILIDKINVFITHVNQDDHMAYVNAFNDVVDYTIFHFDEEEKFMKSFHYPEFEAHKRIHVNLIKKLRECADDLLNGSADKEKIIGFLFSWLVTHILGVDTKYASYYKKN